MDVDVGPLITITLLFLLVAGLATIYHEEIFEAGEIARRYDPQIPDVIIEKPDSATIQAPPDPTAPPPNRTAPAIQTAPILTEPITINSFTSSQRVRFGSGRLIDSDAQDLTNEAGGVMTTLGIPLHTVQRGTNAYYLRGVLDMIQRHHQPSPYAGSVIFLDQVENIKKSRPEQEYFILSVADTIDEPIEITGWKVYDHKEKTSYEIPDGKRIFGSFESPNRPIRVQGGDIAIVSSGISPTGFSFRVNKCSGFRSQFKQFTPPVKTDCPSPVDAFVADSSVPYTDNRCYAFVNSLTTCETVTELPSGVTAACRRFLEKSINEQGCIDLHRNDQDFFLSEWRVFLGSKRSLWRNSDRNIIYLVDQNNLLVATLIY